MLTPEEQQLVRETFARGPAALIEAGFDAEQIKLFLARADVTEYYGLLDRELGVSDALEIRTRFLAKRRLAQLQPGAIAVLGRALAGPQYLRVGGPDGDRIAVGAFGRPIVTTPEVTPVQLRAAEAVLENLGVTPGRVKPAEGVDVSVEILFRDGHPQASIEEDPSHTREAERALSRERVRNVILQLAPEVPGLAKRLNERLGIARDSSPPRPVRKKAVKRAAKAR